MSTVLPAPAPLGTRDRWVGLASYVLLAVPLMMTALPLNLLVPAFYAERTHLALGTIGWLMLSTRLVDAIVDPLLGAWVDASKRRASASYARPLLLAAVPLATAFALVFHPPAWGPVATSVWLLVTLSLSYMAFSLATVAHQAWGAELAHDDAARAKVTATREGAGLIGVLLGGTLPRFIGYDATTAVFAVLLAASLWLLVVRAARPPARSVRANANANANVNVNVNVNANTSANVYLAFVVPLRFSPARWLLGVFAVNALAPAVTSSLFIFFVEDRLGMGDRAGMFLATYFLAGAASMPLWIKLARHVSLHALWLMGMFAAVAAFIWAFWLPQGAAASFGVICMLSGVAFGADLALPPALLARVIDRNGHAGRYEGSYFGLWNAANKLILALASGLALNGVAALGYGRGATSAAALSGLAFVYAIVPCGLKLVAAATLLIAWRRDRF